MSLEALKQQQTQLVLQRSMLKDQLEANERGLGQVSFAIKALEAAAKADEEQPTED